MELRHLRYFIAVAETKNLSHAVDRLHIAQPALSQSIKALENELGVLLFSRSRKGMELTDVGGVFLNHAYAVVRQADKARQSVLDAVENPHGSVSLGAPASASKVIIEPLYRLLTERYPNLHINHEEGLQGNLRAAFDMGLYDLMIETDASDSDDVTLQSLIDEDIFLVSAARKGGTKNLGAEPHIAFKDLAKHPIFTLSTRHGMGRAIDKHARAQNVSLQLLQSQFALQPTLQIVMQGRANVVLPWSAIYDLVDKDLIQAQRIVEPAITRSVGIITANTQPRTNATSKVIEIIKEVTRMAHAEGKWRGTLRLDEAAAE